MSGTNPVAAYGTTDFTSQTGTAYKTQLDANSVVAKRIVGRFAAHAQSSPNMTVAVDAGSLFDGTTLTEIAAQNTGSITAPSTHPRIDRVVIDNATGAASVVTGTEAVSPTPPAIPYGKSPVAQVALATSTTAITNAIITDERNFSATNVGTFGTQTTLASASTCDLGQINTHNILVTGTTTIASFGSSASTSNPLYFIEFAASLTLTYDGTAMILPGGTDIVAASGDSAIAEYLGSGLWRVRVYQRATGQPLVTAQKLVGHAIYASSATGTSASPILNGSSTPSTSNGSNALNVNYTPTKVGNIIVVQWTVVGGSNTSGVYTTLFKDSGANPNAISAAGEYCGTGFLVTVSGVYTETAADTSSHNWQVNYGPATSGTAYLNQTSGGSLGGIITSYIEVFEYTP